MSTVVPSNDDRLTAVMLDLPFARLDLPFLVVPDDATWPRRHYYVAAQREMLTHLHVGVF